MQQDVDIIPMPRDAVGQEAGGCCGGGCCGGAAAEPSPLAAQSFAVEGMTCAHCVGAVTDEVSQIDGVASVSVELVAGGRSTVHVDADGPIDLAAVRAAIDEAGYRLVD